MAQERRRTHGPPPLLRFHGRAVFSTVVVDDARSQVYTMYIPKPREPDFEQGDPPMRTVSKWGNSLAIRIPATFAETLGISEGTEIELRASAGRLVVTPCKHKCDIGQLVAAITPRNRHEEIDWGAPAGREEW